MITLLLSYLLNAFWQAPLVFAAAWLAAPLARRSGPALEHRIWTSALFLEALLPACPAHTLPTVWSVITNLWHNTVMPASTQIIVTTTATYGHTLIHLPVPLLTTLACLFGGAVFYATARLLYSLFVTHQLRRTALPITLSGETLQAWQRCATLFRVLDAHIATSALIAAPSTIGIRNRLLLLPAAMPPTLSQQDLNAALAHEFAHMQRRDFALNLFYQLIALPIAWHPFLRLTFARIAETREILCDSLAAQSLNTSDPSTDYARSLLRLASLLVHSTSARSPHAIGIFDANIFERRLMHLTKNPVRLRGIRRFASTALCALLGIGTCASALALHTTVPTPISPRQSADAPHTPRVSGGVIAGNRLSFVNPIYPPDAKAAKLSGIVLLHAIIGKDGSIEKLDVISGPEIFQKSALDAVHQWTYKPYLLNGEPTAVDTTITINYSIKK